MPKPNKISISKFLSKPRLPHEIARHFKISKELTNLHLKEAIRSGRVLVSEKPVLKTLRESNGKLRSVRDYLYVVRTAPMLVDGWTKLGIKNADDSPLKSRSECLVKFVSKTHGSMGKEAFSPRISHLVFEESDLFAPPHHHLKTSEHLASGVDVSSRKGRLVRHRTIDQMLGRKPRYAQEKTRSLSHAKAVPLFEALAKEALHFLDLHNRFGVSKQTIKRLVKKGLLMEEWGPKAIGVRFRLAEEGKAYLKELQAAAKYKPKMRKNAYITLRHRASM